MKRSLETFTSVCYGAGSLGHGRSRQCGLTGRGDLESHRLSLLGCPRLFMTEVARMGHAAWVQADQDRRSQNQWLADRMAEEAERQKDLAWAFCLPGERTPQADWTYSELREFVGDLASKV